MFVIPKEEFIEELKAEIEGYEEIDQENRKLFIEKIIQYIDASTDNKKVKKTSKGIDIILKDESDIFELADKYYGAVTSDELEDYWKAFKL